MWWIQHRNHLTVDFYIWYERCSLANGLLGPSTKRLVHITGRTSSRRYYLHGLLATKLRRDMHAIYSLRQINTNLVGLHQVEKKIMDKFIIYESTEISQLLYDRFQCSFWQFFRLLFRSVFLVQMIKNRIKFNLKKSTFRHGVPLRSTVRAE